MKKLITLFSIIAFSIGLMAQDKLMSKVEVSNGIVHVQDMANTNEKITYWSEDFDGERWSSTVYEDGEGYLYNQEMTLPAAQFGGGQWTVSANGEKTVNAEAMWVHWSDVGPRGRFTSTYSEDEESWLANPNNALIESMPKGTSVENGFMLLEGDYANTYENGMMPNNELVFDMDAYIQCGPIDLSESEGARFNIKTYFRYCCDTDAVLALEISIDYDPENPTEASWGIFELNNLTQSNDYTYQNNVHLYISERDVNVNISKMTINDELIAVAGNANVYFRLHKTNASHYFWMIDDLSITEAPKVDLEFTDGFADYIYDAEVNVVDTLIASTNFYGGYTVIPEQVAGDFVKFRVSALNNGMQDIKYATLAVKIKKDNELFYIKEASESVDINVSSVDTLRLNADFSPNERGSYQIVLNATIDGVEENEHNHLWEYDFIVGGNVWSTVYKGNEDSFESAGPRDWTDGGFDGDALVQEFIMPESVGHIKAKGLNFYFQNHRGRENELEAIENGQYAVFAKIWTYNNEVEKYEEIISSTLSFLTIEDTASWVSVDFIEDETIELLGGKSYYVGVACYTGDRYLRFLVGKDMNGPKQSKGGGNIYLTQRDAWFRTNDNYAIELVLSEEYITPAMVTFNCDLSAISSFDASVDELYLTGNFTGWAEPGTEESILMHDEDGDRVYTTTLEIDPNQELKYKYFKNSTWENGEPIDEDRGLNLGFSDMVTNDFWGDLNNVKFDSFEKVKVYPNPFNSKIVIDNIDFNAQIELCNALGQVVKSVNVNEQSVILNTEYLDKGIYILLIRDDNNNVKTERIVKH